MRLPKLLSLWLILLAAVLPAAAHAQRAAGLRVVVREDGTGRAIPGAQVVVGGVGTVAVSDSTGVAHSPSVPLGQRLVRVERQGYETEVFSVDFGPDDTVEAEVDMVRAPIQLEGVTVTERMPNRGLHEAGFFARRNAGFGQFLDRAQIEARRPDRLSTLFRGVPGVQVVQCGGRQCGAPGYILTSSLGNVSVGGVCRMTMYVDGVRVDNEDIDQWSVNGVEAVEVYRHVSSIPARFNVTGSSCGVVLIWTRAEA